MFNNQPGGKYQLAKYMAIAQFNSEENKGNILKSLVLTNSVKDSRLDQLQQKQKGRITPLHVRKQQEIQLSNQMEHSNQR